MSKKKRFGISEALTRGLSETINVVEHNAGVFRNVVLPLSRIELDPDNPRKMAIDLMDIRQGIRPDDLVYQRKQEELEKLKELAHTIKSSGVINPVIVYKLGEFYRIVAGERRCLASILAGKQEIEARVFTEKPKGFELKLIQWVENTAREDLTLDERLGNIKDLLEEYKSQHKVTEINATTLKNITGLSLSQSTYYLAVLYAPSDVQIEIQKGTIRNLDKAALIASISQEELRREIISACISGSSLKELRNLIGRQKTLTKVKMNDHSSNRGRNSAKIHMGSTFNARVVKTIVESVLVRKEYAGYEEYFSQINWLDFRQSTRAFKKLIEILEIDMAV